MSDIREGLCYDDVLLRPARSGCETRSDRDLWTHIVPGVTADVPLISANMDTVTENRMAEAMAAAGGIGIIHRFCEPEEQAEMIRSTFGAVGAAIGVDGDFRYRACCAIDAGADFLCLDVAHGHLEKAIDAVSTIDDSFDAPLMAGNVATAAGAEDLYRAGADSIKVGIGPGSHCITREVAGVGVPQFTAVRDVAKGLDRSIANDDGYTIVADGGIRSSGDIVIALAAGADAVMSGSLFYGCREAAAETVERADGLYNLTRGMASDEAQTALDGDGEMVVEGVEGIVPVEDEVADVVEEMADGIRSGLSYIGEPSVAGMGKLPDDRFISVRSSTQQRNGCYDIDRR